MISRPLGRSAVLALAGLSLLAACTKPAGKATESPAVAASEPVPPGAILQEQPSLGPNNDAMPRLVTSDFEPYERINAALAALDADWKENVAQCTDGEKAISRDVSVTRNTPGFLAVNSVYDVSCGGAYPSSGTDQYAYDLTTGALADWAKLLPKAGITNGERIPDYPSNTFSSATLQARLVKAIEASAGQDADWRESCLPVIQMEGLTLQATFDAEKPVLNIAPGELPHAVQACGDSMALTVDELKALGADARLIAAVEAVGKK